MNNPGTLFSVAHMSWSWRLLKGAALVLGVGLLGGCLPSAHSQLDEEKEPHFLAGKARVNAMDYRGAVDSFEKALEVNPQSASAHLELGWLYENKEGDAAAAIYHYERFLRFRPKADNADAITNRIVACKQQIASTVSLSGVSPSIQREFEKLTEDNKTLREELTKAQAMIARLQAQTNAAVSPVAPANTVFQATPGTDVAAADRPNPAKQSPRVEKVPSNRVGRTHTVRSGETMTAIARQYGIRVGSLTAANPRVEPRRLQVGQVLTIPAP